MNLSYFSGVMQDYSTKPKHKRELSLTALLHALQDIGSPHLALPPTIHVAGTNGKCSTITFMKAILESMGLRVHVYTSPHLIKINERIMLAGQQISDAYFQLCIERLDTVAQKH